MVLSRDDGGMIEWEITGKYNGGRVEFDAKVVGEEEKFATFYRTSSRRNHKPPFLRDITDLLKNDIVRYGREPLASFSGTANSCRASSPYFTSQSIYCAFNEDSVIVGPFYHTGNKDEQFPVQWMFRLNQLGGVEAFVRSKNTEDWKWSTGLLNGWKGFGDYTVMPKE